ncbi:MAG TPA: Clp1/GlmU family protein [Candidatus Brocadiaceae bacterium]
MMSHIDIPDGWECAAGHIQQDTKTCIVVGNIDSGKSTLCKYLIQTWTASGINVGYVDSDLGQSTLGPPATVCLKVFKTPPQTSDFSNPPFLHFVGNTSPEGFLLQTLLALKLLVDKSHRQGSGITLIDTTGFVDGPVARILKLHKIEMLQPQRIIAVQVRDEIEHLLAGYEKMGWQVTRLASSKRAIVRTPADRQRYRAEKYRAYFQNAKIVKCSLDKLILPACILGTGQKILPSEYPKEVFGHGSDIPYLEKCVRELLVIAERMDTSVPLYKLRNYFDVASIVLIEKHELRNLLVGLNDRDNNTLGVGTVVDLDPYAGTLTLFTPVPDIHKVSTIRLGAIKIERGERESGKTRVIHYV